MGKPFPAAKVWLFVLLGFVVPGLSQITNLGSQPPAVPSTCSISTEEIRVLPNDYQRSVLQPFVSTVAGENFNESAADLAACRYLSFDPAFDLLIGSNRTLYQIGLDRPYNFAHEGGIYLPDSNEVLVLPDSKAPRTLNRLSLDTGAITPVPLEAPIGVPNGAARYDGQVVVTTFGDSSMGIPAGVLQLDVYNGTWSWVLNNWFGLRFNGPNDIVALDDGTIIFADSAFGTGFTPSGETQEAVYLIPPTGPAKVLINTLPPTLNGLALSADQSTLYVSTTAANTTNVADQVSDHSIFAFDLANINGGIFAQNMRTFAVIDHGFADGFKLDDYGNVFASSADGVDVFNPAGILIGKIAVAASQSSQQNVNNVEFAGSRLVLMHNTNVLMLQLDTTG